MLKYRIDELLKTIPHEKAKLFFRWLPTQLDITPKTLRSWRKLKIGDTGDIPSEKLFQIASFFEVEPKELFYVLPESIQINRPGFNATKIQEI